ncbi:MAG TPA: excinuclease ABC subunit A, partial [Puia sp.]|nr:excinuclease ABC subunit A [Puia sp.]
MAIAEVEKKRKANAVSKAAKDVILIKGARTHNLKNITVEIPRNKLIVVTGVSGSGKSSLTIDTLFAEGQRRYAESLSAYARQFMARMNKPDVDYIKGLCPAIAIEQKVITRTPRSTVGSMTEIYDYLRLLFARIGKTISPVSEKLVKKDDVNDVVEKIVGLKENDKALILVLFKQHKNRDAKEELNILLQKGFSRLYLREKTDEKSEHGEIIRIEDLLELKDADLKKKLSSHVSRLTSYILIDRLVVKEFDESDKHRIADSVSTAFFEGEGEMLVEVNDHKQFNFSDKFELDGIKFEEPSPNLFSFNNPYGACPTCEGFSQVLGIDEDLVIPDKRLSVYEGAVAPWKGEKLVWWKEQFIKAAKKFNFPIHKPIIDLTKEQYKILWEGNGHAHGINGFFEEVERNLYKVQYRVLLSRYRGRTLCPECKGYRLRKEALYVKIGDKNIGELGEMPIVELQQWFHELSLSEFDKKVAKRILTEIHHRLKTLLDVGLGYLTLNRLANSLSGG